MKKLFLLALLVTAGSLFKTAAAQSCVVHIFSKGWSSKIYVDDKLLTGLNKDEALEYTITDGKRHTFSAKFADNFSIDFTVKTEDATDLYYIVYEMIYPIRAAKNKEIKDKEWNKESKNFLDLIQMSDTENSDGDDSEESDD